MKRLVSVGLVLLGLLKVTQGFSQGMSEEMIYQDSIHTLSPIFQSQRNIFSVKGLVSHSLFVPLALTGYGFVGLESDGLKSLNFEFREEVQEHYPNFKTGIDNYLQFSPAVATFALKIAGKESEHGFGSSIRLYVTSGLLMAGTVYALKSLTHIQRPDGSTYNSFPSGHTATAFVAAEFMHQEFKNTAPLLSYSGYVAASATGALRMLNNRHYFTDVLTGAGIGILTTKAGYWLNHKLFDKNRSTH